MYSLSLHHDENCWHQAPPVDSKKKHNTTNHLSPSYDLHQTEHDETRGQKAPPSGSEKKHQTDLLFPTSYLWRVDGSASVLSSQPHPSLSLFTFTFHFFFVITNHHLSITYISHQVNLIVWIFICCGSHYLCLSWSIYILKRNLFVLELKYIYILKRNLKIRHCFIKLQVGT